MKISRYLNNFFRQIRYSVYIYYIKLKINDFSFYTYSKTNNDLKDLFDKYGSDKGNINNKHNYHKFYSLIFKKIKLKKINLLEVGLGSTDDKIDFHMKFMGLQYKPLASLFAWKDYFINSKIIFIDTNNC